MAKKSVKSDRQAVIEEIRKKQKGADRRRGFAIIGVCALIAVVILGLAIYPIIKRNLELREFNGLKLEEIGAAASVCQKVTKKPAERQLGPRRRDPDPVVYTDAPPAFGQHWNEPGVAPAAFERKFYTANDRPELESLVHNLEHGYTILWYDETAADDGDMINTIEGIADKFTQRRRQLPAEVHRRTVDLRGRRGLPGRPAHRVLALVRRRQRRDRHEQAGGRLAVLLGAERRRPQDVHGRLPLHRLARARR